MKPFYIESDEEVTSVIDRLRASQQKQNIFVIPDGATLLQSAVNMRLLLREAQKAQKEIAIVTSDEYGQTLAQKVGITTYEDISEVKGLSQEGIVQDDTTVAKEESIGSASYYEVPPQHNEYAKGANPVTEVADAGVRVSDTIQESDQHVDYGDHLTEKQQAASIQRAAEDFERLQQKKNVQVQNPQRAAMDMQPVQREMYREQVPPQAQQPSHSSGVYNARDSFSSVMDPHKQKEVQAFFGRRQSAPYQGVASTASGGSDEQRGASGGIGTQKNMASYAHVPEEMHTKKVLGKKFIIALSGGAILLLVALMAIIFFPRVTVALKPTVREESVAINVTADAAQTTTDFEKKRIGLTLLEKDLQKTMSFEATGTSTAGSYKARGSVTIYNNYSEKSQKLVATTRLVTDNGTLFRLVKGVTVPGMHRVDGKMVPGSVVADVIADKAGGAFNIGPSTFTIPGFKGSPRYKSFSAKSEAPMIGGSSAGGTQTIVTKEDLENAKKATEEAAMKELKEQIATDAREQNKKLLDDAIRTEVTLSSTQVVEGVVAKSFDYTVRVTARALVFSEKDIAIMATKALQKRIGKEDVTMRDIALTYSPSLADFDKQTLELKVRGTARIVPDVDVVAVRNALAGKKKNDIDSILSGFAGIEQAELRYSMGFLMGRLPWYKGSITVVVEE